VVARLLIVTGPVACGKTTIRRIIRRILGPKSVSMAITPFSMMNHVLLRTLETVLGVDAKKGGSIASLEANNPRLLGKLLRLLFLIDVIQLILASVISNIMLRIGFVVVVEDHLPTMVLDHFLYSRLYGGRIDGLLVDLYRISMRLVRSGNAIGVYINTDPGVRVSRSRLRGYREADINVLHDKARSAPLLRILRSLTDDVVVVDNNGPIGQTMRRTMSIIGSWSKPRSTHAQCRLGLA
jgi:hypothetical protein